MAGLAAAMALAAIGEGPANGRGGFSHGYKRSSGARLKIEGERLARREALVAKAEAKRARKNAKRLAAAVSPEREPSNG
jgi:hypothetical protein